MSLQLRGGTVPLSCILLLLSACGSPPREIAQDRDPFSQVHGPYLGQNPPGLTPEIFAPGLVSTEMEEAGVTVYPGGGELYFWSVEPVEGGGGPKVTIYMTKMVNGSWSTPEPVSFSSEYSDMYPAIHPDGSRMYFQSDRPIDPSESAFEYNIWYVDRVGDGWGEPRSMGRPINGPNHTGGAAVTLDGTMYFTLMDLESGSSNLYRSAFVDGVYQEPERLPDRVNFYQQNCDSYISPDESYLIFTAFPARGHQGNPGDLYISFRSEDGTWGEVRRMGPDINSEDQFGSATISPDGRYIFFTVRHPAEETGLDVYWVDAGVVDSSR